MEFYWLTEAENVFALMGYDAERIAILKWNASIKVWELESSFLEVIGVLDIAMSQSDVDNAKKEAIEMLIKECQAHMYWINNQLDRLIELQKKE